MRFECCSRREALLALAAASAALVVPGLAGCNPGGNPTPPTISFDQDECDWCRMTIDDPRLAAAFVPVSGRALRFGEPGCLLSWLAEQRSAGGTPFVAAREDGAWLSADSAKYARGLVRTPMGFDLAAWRTAPEATEAITTWSTLLEEGAPRARRS